MFIRWLEGIIVQTLKVLTNHNTTQQIRFLTLVETFAEGLSFVRLYDGIL